MAVRNLLHKSKLEAFLEWAKEQGAAIETPKGIYQKARFRFPGEAPHIIYDKHSDEHYSLEILTSRLREIGWFDADLLTCPPRIIAEACLEVLNG